MPHSAPSSQDVVVWIISAIVYAAWRLFVWTKRAGEKQELCERLKAIELRVAALEQRAQAR